MSHQQFHQQHQQWRELEEAGQDEVKGRAEMDRQDADAEFARQLEDKFPILKGWTKESK